MVKAYPKMDIKIKDILRVSKCKEFKPKGGKQNGSKSKD